MKYVTLALFLFISLAANKIHAQQKQGAWWYFGDKAGLNFNTTPPAPDFSGKSYSSFGSASISDANGNLLIYSDGTDIYDRNHQVMPNGSRLGPVAEAAMLVQKPGSSFLYYLFTIDNIKTNNPPNLTYTIIDMRLNGGKGAVVNNSKKVVMITPVVAYKLTACLHSNNRDIWIITHSRSGDSFYSSLLSSTGLAQPVISNTGISYNLSHTPSGTLKSSPNSQMVGDAVHWSNVTQLLDFDRTSGVLSNARTFTFNTGPWGISFSPDNTKLYLNDSYNIYQYNLLAGSFQNILASKFKVDKNLISLDLQLGMNGKIYITPGSTRPIPPWGGINNPHLSVINCPNALGAACSFQDTVIYLGRSARANLPALNQTLFRNANILQLTAAKPYICAGDSVKLSAFGAGADQFTWLPAAGLSKLPVQKLRLTPRQLPLTP